MSRHIGIALIAPDMMHTQTTRDLIVMTCYQQKAHGDQLTLSHRDGSILGEARQATAKDLIEHGADWILYVDSDMGFPMTALQHLLSFDVDVVGANCSRRKRPIGPTARVRNPATGELDPVWPEKGRGLQQVETLGTGFLLIKADVFRRIEWPWFNQPWVEEHQRWAGEDTFFCGRCHEAGIPLHIDHDLSWAIKHYGQYGFSMRDVVAERQLAEAGAQYGD